MTVPVTDDYGLGLRLTANAGGVLVGHNGSMPGFLAVAVRRPRLGDRRDGAHQRHHRASTPSGWSST